MNIDLKKFLGLTALMSAPLVMATSGCIITSNSGNDDGATASASASDGTGSATNGDGDGDGDGDADGTGDGDGDGDGDTGTDGGTEGADDTDGDGSTGDEPIDVGDCCTDKVAPGCSIDEIEACVCAVDEGCCSVEIGWDEVCVELVTTECRVVCPE